MPFVIYSSLRLALIAAAAVVLYLAGMRGWLLAVVAVVVALCLSYLFLNGPRTRAAQDIAARRARRRALAEAGIAVHGADEDSEDGELAGSVTAPDARFAPDAVADDAEPDDEPDDDAR